MKKGLGEEAYTIIEAMIFLAVSSFLFTMIVIAFTGQQDRTQFNQSVKDLESRLIDLANDISNGFYSSPNSFTCSSLPGDARVTFTGGSTPRGENDGCIFAGQVIEFTPGDSRYTVTPLAGKQRTLSGIETREVTSIAEANPIKVPGSVVIEQTNYDVNIAKITFSNGASSTNITALAIMVTFGSYNGSDLNSGDIHADVVPLTSGVPGSASDWTNAYNNRNPAGGVTICLQEGSGSRTRHGAILLGGAGKQLTIISDITNGACP